MANQQPQNNAQASKLDPQAQGADAQKKDPVEARAEAPAKEYPKRAHVRTKTGGEMLHLFTNERIDGDGKRIDIDHFAIAQIEAGKWEIFDPNAE